MSFSVWSIVRESVQSVRNKFNRATYCSLKCDWRRTRTFGTAWTVWTPEQTNKLALFENQLRFSTQRTGVGKSGDRRRTGQTFDDLVFTKSKGLSGTFPINLIFRFLQPTLLGVEERFILTARFWPVLRVTSLCLSATLSQKKLGF